MWGKRKGRVTAFLDDASEIEGRYTCSGTVMLDAKFRGEITAHDTLIIGAQAVVDATIEASILVVHGQLHGNVVASDRVEMKRGARVTGDIAAPVLLMEAGAVLDGRLRMTRDEPAEAPHGVVVPLKK